MNETIDPTFLRDAEFIRSTDLVDIFGMYGSLSPSLLNGRRQVKTRRLSDMADQRVGEAVSWASIAGITCCCDDGQIEADFHSDSKFDGRLDPR